MGFAPTDFIEMGVAVLVVAICFVRPWYTPFRAGLARRTGLCAALLFVLAIGLRMALLPLHPVPTPSGADDFSYLLLGDTLAHFRLANPPHPMHKFFETTFVLQQPTYSSIYPIGPGIALAIGQLVFGLPWAGVVLSVAGFCVLCYWMLLGWTTPGWALVGGVVAVCQFGPLNMWMNCYWGGAVSAIAGCLVFGALGRLRQTVRTRDSILLGLGLGLQLLSRPFESVLLDLSVVLFFVFELRGPSITRAVASVGPERSEKCKPLNMNGKFQQPPLRLVSSGSSALRWIPALLAIVPAVALLLAQNKAVTGSWTTLPYVVSRYQYGVPTTFTFQKIPVPHARLTPAQQLYFEGQAAAHGGSDDLTKYLKRLLSRAALYRFFLLPSLWLAVPVFLLLLRQFRFLWIALTLALFALGTNFYPYFFPHYIAAVTCLFVLVAVLGLERLSRFRGGQQAAQLLVVFAIGHFIFWYGVHAFAGEPTLSSITQYETADAINFGDPAGRIATNKQLAEAPGRQLVFIRYYSTHEYHEWVHNSADIDGQRVIRALELDPGDNAKLERYSPGRTVWLLEPDATPPRLSPYSTAGPFLPVP
jgi:hypothetical protein